jgi:hypothetical protein
VSTSCSQGSPSQSIGTMDVVGAPRNLPSAACRLSASRVLAQEARDTQTLRTHNQNLSQSQGHPAVKIQEAHKRLLTAFNAIIPCRLHFFSQSSGNFNGSFEMLYVRSLFVFPLNGLRPKISSYAHTPRDHQSMLYVYPRLVRISGAMYAIEPATPVSMRRSEKCTAMLKSVKWA